MFFDPESAEPTVIEKYIEQEEEERKEKRASAYESDLNELGLDAQGKPKKAIGDRYY